MPTEASLERLRALTQKLAPLGRVQRGTLIRAQDWNALVDAVLDVARAVLGEDRAGEVPPHDHADQVSIGWLEPKLRARVERGPLSEPDERGRLAAVERDLRRAAERAIEVDTRLLDLRAHIVEVATRHDLRDAELGDLRKSVARLRDGEDAVGDLRAALRSVQAGLDDALELGRGLAIDGRPADLGALDRRLQVVEELRARLTLSSGQLLDAGTVERRFAGLDARFATKDELTEIAARPVAVDAAELSAIEDRLQSRLRTELDRSGQDLAARLTRSTEEALSGVDARATRAVSEALPAFAETVLARARADASESLRAGLDGALAAAQGRIAASESALSAAFMSQIESLTAGVATRVRAELERELPSRLADVTGAAARLSRSLEGAMARIEAAEVRLAGAETRALEIGRSEAAARAELHRSLVAEMERQGSLQADVFRQQLGRAKDDLSASLQATLTDARRTILDDARAAATQAALAEVKIASAQLRSDVRSVARDEIAVARGEGLSTGGGGGLTGGGGGLTGGGGGLTGGAGGLTGGAGGLTGGAGGLTGGAGGLTGGGGGLIVGGGGVTRGGPR